MDAKQEKWEDFVDELSDDEIYKIAAQATPWSSGTRINDEMVDEDGFSVSGSIGGAHHSFKELQKQCWKHAQENPHINSHVRDFTGNLTGSGFSTDCDVREVSDVIKEISDDIRNELPIRMSKYVARSEIQGELFLMLTCHKNGFIEIDFQEPLSLSGGPEDEGIYHHPTKKTMPVFYRFSNGDDGKGDYIVPSIYVAHAPQLAIDTIQANKINPVLLKNSKAKGYDKIGGYKRFIVSWDRSFLTVRNVSHIKTTIEWINHYVNLKKWEIDHKKSSGSYLWIVSMEDPKAFRTWLKMTDAEKMQTGLTSKKTPGGTLILPPGVKLTCENPKLASISEQDTDIMHLITAGLNKPEDMVTGQTSGDTFSGVNASRGPQADRISDEMAYFERFLRFTLWRSVFFLRSKLTSFKNEYKVKEAVSFKGTKPIMKTVTKFAYELVDFDFPVSEVSDVEGKTKAYLGVNHQSLSEVLGIPHSDIAKKLGFSNYAKRRLQYETEKSTYPELPTSEALRTAANTLANGDTKNNSNTNDKNDNSNDKNKDKNSSVQRRKLRK